MSSTRYCNIHRLLWNDDKFPYVSDDCQLVTLHTFTSNYMTNFGLAQVSVYALAEQKKWGPKGKKKADHNRYLKGFREGLDEGFYKYDEFNQMVYVPNMKKYNPPGNPNILISWGKEYNLFPECELKVLFYQSYKAFMEGFGKGFQDAFGKAFAKASAKALPKPHVVVVESEYVSEESKDPLKEEMVHVDKLSLSDSMKQYAEQHGLNGKAHILFSRMVDWCIKKNKKEELFHTQRGWEAQYRTFVQKAPEYNKDLFSSLVGIQCDHCHNCTQFDERNHPFPCPKCGVQS